MLIETVFVISVLVSLCVGFYFYTARCALKFKETDEILNNLSLICRQHHIDFKNELGCHIKIREQHRFHIDELRKNFQDLTDIKAAINFCDQRREIKHPFEERFDAEISELKKNYHHKMEMYEGEFTNFKVDIWRQLRDLPVTYPILKLHVGEEDEQPKRKRGRPRKNK